APCRALKFDRRRTPSKRSTSQRVRKTSSEDRAGSTEPGELGDLAGAARNVVDHWARVIHAGIVRAVAIPIADDRSIAPAAELAHLVVRVDLVVAVGVDDPMAVAIDTDFVDAVAVEVADDGDVARLAELERRIGLGEAAVAVEIEIPLAVAEHADVLDAVA